MQSHPTGSHIRCYDPVRSEWVLSREEEARQQSEAEAQRLTAELERLRSI